MPVLEGKRSFFFSQVVKSSAKGHQSKAMSYSMYPYFPHDFKPRWLSETAASGATYTTDSLCICAGPDKEDAFS
jgi:hypothetical protein